MDSPAPSRFFVVLCSLASAFALLVAPLFVSAAPFGGKISLVKPCYNKAIYARVGAPRGGPHIWTPKTKTYKFGPPKRAGQWILGLNGANYYCIVKLIPLTVWPGKAITMMGSSR